LQEVVALEEKALQLSSGQLKAQHELRSAQDALDQRHKQLAAVEADRTELRQAMAALQVCVHGGLGV
jgi:chromosome segregation ATPase